MNSTHCRSSQSAIPASADTICSEELYIPLWETAELYVCAATFPCLLPLLEPSQISIAPLDSGNERGWAARSTFGANRF